MGSWEKPCATEITENAEKSLLAQRRQGAKKDKNLIADSLMNFFLCDFASLREQ